MNQNINTEKCDKHPCDDCGCEIVFDYAATHRSWNKTVGTPDNICGDGTMLCVNCFCIRARAVGEHPYFTRMFVIDDRFHWERGNETTVEDQRAALDKLQRKYNTVKGDLATTKAREQWLAEQLAHSYHHSEIIVDEHQKDPAHWLKRAQEETG